MAASDIAYTAATRREHLEHRLAVVGTRREELFSALEAFAKDQDPVNLVTGRVRSTDSADKWLSSAPGKVPNGGAWVANFWHPCRSSDGKSRDAPMR